MSEAKGKPKAGWRRELIGWAMLPLGIFTIQSVAARPFYIPSDSMMPALVSGDRLIVSKYPYGFSYASPAIRLTGFVPGRLLGRLPARGDIVIVNRRGDNEILIKRVIGLPGDTIAVSHGVVILNGKPVPRVPNGRANLPVDANIPCDEGMLAPFREVGQNGKLYCRLPLYRETLPGGASYDTIDLGDTDLPGGYLSPGDNFAAVTVPAGHVFLMGDNRDQSADSRFPLPLGLGGPVPIESIGGRAEFVTHSYDGSGSSINPIDWVATLRSGRAGSLRPERR